MPRTARKAPGGVVFHCLNRGNDRSKVFSDDGDYAAFEKAMEEVLSAIPMRLLAYCLMPTHWHLLLWPTKEGQLGRFMQRLTVMHVRRWHAQRHSTGTGHVYQGIYRSFPVQDDLHFLKVARYVERNALRASLVERAQDWRWCSLWRRQQGSPEGRAILSAWPVARPSDWVARVNRPQPTAEEQAVRLSLSRGRPFGDPQWQRRAAARLGLEKTFRDRGRPKKQERQPEGRTDARKGRT